NEPVLVREKLYLYRLHGLNTIGAPEAAVDAEYASVLRKYFITTAAHGTKNPLAPSFSNWPNSLGVLRPDNARVLLRMFDEFIETSSRQAIAGEVQTGFTMRQCISGNRVTIISHDLSRSGAPM